MRKLIYHIRCFGSLAVKVVRSTARMTNLFVILFGAGFTAVLAYALTSELFSKNSATVLYGQACELIKSSPNVRRPINAPRKNSHVLSQVTQYFKGPLVFHNSPPSAVRPRHRNDRVASQSGRDAYGRETLLLNFYVEAKHRSGSAIIKEDQTWWESVNEWTSQRVAAVSDTTPEQAWEVTKEFANEKWDGAKRLFRFLSGDPVPGAKTSASVPVPEVKEVKQESGWKSSFTGLFSGIRGTSRDSGDMSIDGDDNEGHMEGEVQAMLVMVRDSSLVMNMKVEDSFFRTTIGSSSSDISESMFQVSIPSNTFVLAAHRN